MILKNKNHHEAVLDTACPLTLEVNQVYMSSLCQIQLPLKM